MTTTSRRLCQHSMDLEAYRDKKYAQSLGEMAHNLQKVSRDVGSTLNRSVTFKEPRQSSPLRSISSAGNLRSFSVTDADIINKLYDKEFPRATMSETSPGISKSRAFDKEEEIAYPVYTQDYLVREYFPLTLSASFELDKMKADLSKTQAEVVSTRRSRSRSRPKSALTRLRTDASREKYNRLKEPKFEMVERSDVDKMYLMSSEAPRTGSAAVYVTSPFQSEIAALRMERLRIEEERLLEMQRLEELEKLRPPKVKWYESTGPDFHYECHKNTELEKSNQRWEDTLRKWEDTKTSINSVHTSKGDIICL